MCLKHSTLIYFYLFPSRIWSMQLWWLLFQIHPHVVTTGPYLTKHWPSSLGFYSGSVIVLSFKHPKLKSVYQEIAKVTFLKPKISKVALLFKLPARFLILFIISSKLFTTFHLYCPCLPSSFIQDCSSPPHSLFPSYHEMHIVHWMPWPLMALTSLQSNNFCFPCVNTSLSRTVQWLWIWTLKSDVLVKGASFDTY